MVCTNQNPCRPGWPEWLGVAALAGCVLLASCASEPIASAGWRDEPPEVLAHSSGSGPLRAGAARLSLDAPFAGPMAGYVGASWFRLRELRDPLFVRAIVLEQPGFRFAFVVLDRVLIPPALREAVEARVEFQRARVQGWIAAATHCHTAPGGFLEAWPAEILGLGTYDPLLFEQLVDRTARAIEEAASRLTPVRVEAGRTLLADEPAALVSFNRRDPGAPADPSLDVIRFTAGSLQPAQTSAVGHAWTVARIARFAAHPTLIPFYLRRASGDFPGVLCRTLEGAGAGVTLFAPGACADLAAGSSGDSAPAGWERRLERIGRRLALESRTFEQTLAASGDAVPLAHLKARVRLPPRVPWSVPFVGRSIASHYPEHALIQCVRLGDSLVVTFPGEMSSELGERLRQTVLERTGARQVLLWTLADHYIGYAFSKESLEKGGKGQHLAAYGPELGDFLLDRMTALAERCWESWQPAPIPAPAAPATDSKSGD